MLQQQLAVDLGLNANATIFEICAALDVQGLDVEAVLASLEIDLKPIVEAQINQIVLQIVDALETLGIPVSDDLIDEILANIDIDAIVAQILANVEVSLEILEVCLEQTRTTLTVTKTTQCDEGEFGAICDFNPQLTVTGTSPNPNSFPATSTPTVVTLGAGQYSVSEAGFVPDLQACSDLGFDGGQPTANASVFICTDFSADCEGEISLGQELSCNINNVVIDTTTPPCGFDFVVSNFNSDVDGENDNVQAHLNNGAGTFSGPTGTSPPDWEVADEPASVALADFNGDGILDFVTANFGGDSFSVSLGTGNGEYGAATTTALSDGPRFVAVGLFNADTIPDLAIAVYNNDELAIFLGDGDGTFTQAADVPVGDLPRSIAVADFNGDNIPDLAVANEGTDNVSILLGDGDGTFTPATPATLGPTGDEPRSVAVGDLDGDGLKDDIVTANFGADNLSIWFGDDDGTFTGPTTIALTSNDDPIYVVAADFDCDGFDDLAVALNTADDVAILLNDGTGTMYDRTDIPTGSEPTSIAVGHID